MTPPPDPDRIRLPRPPEGSGQAVVRPPQPPAGGEHFLKGPVPWAWLDRAARLSGKSLAVGLVLWKKAGAAGNRTIPFCQAGENGLGLGEHSARRGRRTKLERAGLDRGSPACRAAGCEVTLLDALRADGGRWRSPGSVDRSRCG